MPKEQKLIIYQLFVRLFGNKHTKYLHYGDMEENGCGKFDDINQRSLTQLKKLGITHIWFTGAIAHGTMTDFSAYGIPKDAPEVIKGRAGSPYAIKDYYDVHPALASTVPHRMDEFEALLQRTRDAGLKVLIDFVPNHVARQYRSLAKPPQVKDLGEEDDPNRAFSAENNFYYLPGQGLTPPPAYEPLGPDQPYTERSYQEFPAKATGNGAFTAHPAVDDWFETIKLNYGLDIQGNFTPHYDPIPNTWYKMRDILLFWAGKGIHGFRCDMVELVPVEFWAWAIPQVKVAFPELLFIAEVYQPHRYRPYLFEGHFDYLYDKVGVYDTVRKLIQQEGSTLEMVDALQQSDGFSDQMLRFLENHDEQRLASRFFAGDPWAAIPGMTVSALLSRGPVMVYFGQEVGEPAEGASGFSGDDGRSSIFDYWGAPEHQKWMNGGVFDGGLLSEDQQRLRSFYQRLLTFCQEAPAIRDGHFYGLPHITDEDERVLHRVYPFLRYNDQQRLLVMANFDREATLSVPVYLPRHAWDCMGKDPFDSYTLVDRLWGNLRVPLTGDTRIQLPPWGAYVFELVSS